MYRSEILGRSRLLGHFDPCNFLRNPNVFCLNRDPGSRPVFRSRYILLGAGAGVKVFYTHTFYMVKIYTFTFYTVTKFTYTVTK